MKKRSTGRQFLGLVLTFIDYISIYTGVNFLKHKAGVFAFLRYFKALAEKQSGKGINILHTDNGGDYSNKYVDNLYPFHLQFFTWQLLRHIIMVCFYISFSFHTLCRWSLNFMHQNNLISVLDMIYFHSTCLNERWYRIILSNI